MRLAEEGADVVLNGREDDQEPRESLEQLRDSGRGGRIINNSSVHEELPFPNFTGYCARQGRAEDADALTCGHRASAAGHHGQQRRSGAIETPISSALMNHPEKIAALLGDIPAQHLGQPGDVGGAVAFWHRMTPAT
ncbi:hypothetical protein [Nitrosomonas communis]|uniref:hypothetical protein n=1 Tax=Nitrosomonas communis TaxID=44574 RepID=UPI00069CB885|nr:hypothetical protein [Nitrosomonas communis]